MKGSAVQGYSAALAVLEYRTVEPKHEPANGYERGADLEINVNYSISMRNGYFLDGKLYPTGDWSSVGTDIEESFHYLCKWCLTYVGQRRQFCSADCAAQYKICQKRRDQKQDLNIAVDYYGRVKLSIQGLPLQSPEAITAQRARALDVSWKKSPRKRCKNCSRVLSAGGTDYCDESCQAMDKERNKRQEFANLFQRKEAVGGFPMPSQLASSPLLYESSRRTNKADDRVAARRKKTRPVFFYAERRRIRKWLLDAQSKHTKPGEPPLEIDTTVSNDEAVVGEQMEIKPSRSPLVRRSAEIRTDRKQLYVDLKWITSESASK